MSATTDRRILAGLKAPAEIAKTIETVIKMQDYGEYFGTPIDNAMLWLLRELGKRSVK